MTVSGDVTIDTSTLKVDSSNNRVGIGNASPDVSLDIGSFTDAIHVPVGTTAQRPSSPAAGYLDITVQPVVLKVIQLNGELLQVVVEQVVLLLTKIPIQVMEALQPLR